MVRVVKVEPSTIDIYQLNILIFKQINKILSMMPDITNMYLQIYVLLSNN